MNGMTMVIITAVIAGVVQSLTGFGAGIVLMIILPSLYAIPQAAGISQAICIAISGLMMWQYRKTISWKKALKPIVPYLVISNLCIQFSTMVDQEIMVRGLGCFLILLSIYYLFFNKNTDQKEMSFALRCVYIAGSGICDGLFGIGGPLMVLYFLNQTKDKNEYLGTMQAFCVTNVIWSTMFRLYNGIIGTAQLPIILAGVIAIMISTALSKKAVEKIDDNVVRKLTYLLIGVSGILNVL